MRSVLTFFLFLPISAAAGVPFPISENPGTEPAVAALSDSSAVVVYGVGDKVFFNIPFTGPESPLAPSGPDTETAPDVATLAGSGFVAVWLADDGVHSRPLARIFGRDGVPVTGLLEIGGSGNVSDISVAAGPAQGFVVTWSKFWPPGQENVFVRAFDAAGQPISAELQVSEDENAHHVHPKVAAAPDGSFTVAWGTFTPQISTSRARRHPGSAGSWNDSWLVAENAAYPTIAIADDGGVLLAWAANQGKQEVWGRRPGEAAVMFGGSGAGPVGMARHRTGVAAVTWHEGGIGAPGRLRARFSDSLGQPAGEVVSIAENVIGSGNPPGVAVSEAGRVVFVWEDQATGRIHGRWWDEPIVPVRKTGWGTLKSLWR
ncbi:MAG: hypothetical protein ABFS42_06220 [Candidatus Krumholzibacteriota bacterium]